MFIVIDTIDGGGKGKQREEVIKYFKVATQIQIDTEEFPVHNAFYENVIHPALQEQTTMNNSSWVLAYLLDKTLSTPKIENYVNDPSNLFISDGYFTTTIAYQSLLMNQINLDKLLEYSVDFEIPVPDLTIYLDVDPQIAYDRKINEPGHSEGLDMFEKSLDKQKRLRDIFKRMVKENIYCNWKMIDGNRSVEEVRDDIISIVKGLINI